MLQPCYIAHRAATNLALLWQQMIIETHIEELDSAASLPLDEQQLLEDATAAMGKAYAPYSRFKVGAALLMENGMTITGNNQENMAYPSGLCAERVAFFAAGSQYPGMAIHKVAITAGSENFASDHPIAPCGACRQAMLEFEVNQQSPITVIMRGRTGKVYRVHGIRTLLPLFFHEAGLKG
ncbi:MAG: cytidine deaminase [Flavobacteriales bacterium]